MYIYIKSAGFSCVCYPGMHVGHRDDGINTDTTGEMQVCEQQLDKKNIAGVKKRADERRQDELRVEVGVKATLKKRLERSGLDWAGRVESMGDGR